MSEMDESEIHEQDRHDRRMEREHRERAEIAALKQQRDDANATAMRHLASIAELEGRVKMYVEDIAALKQQLAEAKEARRILSDQAHDHAAMILAYQDNEDALRAHVAELEAALTEARAEILCDETSRREGESNFAWETRVIAQIDAALSGASSDARWPLGTMVHKIKGASWRGRIVGYYSTELTPEGYCVESTFELGSVQIYPRGALELDGAQ